MRISFRSLATIALLSCLATPCFAQHDGSRERSASSHKSSGTSPEKDMKGINHAVKAIAKFLKAPKGDAPMDQVEALQKLAMDAKFKIPGLTAKKPKAEQAAFVKAYRKQINSLIRGALDLSEAMEDKDWAKASEVLAAINSSKKDGHKKFKGRRRHRRR